MRQAVVIVPVVVGRRFTEARGAFFIDAPRHGNHDGAEKYKEEASSPGIAAVVEVVVVVVDRLSPLIQVESVVPIASSTPCTVASSSPPSSSE